MRKHCKNLKFSDKSNGQITLFLANKTVLNILYLHIIKVGFRQTSLSKNTNVLAFEYIINVTEVWQF